jgi:phospholipid/cholesterol/gamma-HCH transport system permease protein
MTTPAAQPLRPLAPPRRVRGGLSRLLGAIGGPVVDAAHWAASNAALAATVAFMAMRRSSWRRTVSAEFKLEVRETVLGVLPATCVMALLVGIGLLYQALYWAETAGQVTLLGRIIVVVLMRELAPALVALLIIGRSGTSTLMHLSQMRDGGQLRMLDSQGVDPFLLLVLPRTLAFTIGCFTLTILFIAITMVAGYVTATAIGFVKVTFLGFIDMTLRSMGRGDFLIVPLKAIVLGFTIGIVCCHTALTHSREATRVVATGFVRAALAVLAMSGLLSLVV